MTTPTLTHEQAEQLRMAGTGALLFTDIHAGRILSWAMKDGIAGFSDLHDGSMRWALTDAGREALAKYDAEWVIVRREHLVALTERYRNMLIPTIKLAQAIAHANEVLEGK